METSKYQRTARVRMARENAHVEHSGILEGLAIYRHPLIPGDGLTFFVDVFEISIKPTPRRWTGKFAEWRFGVANQMFEESGGEGEEQGGKNSERK